MQDRLYSLYDKIEQNEAEIAELQTRIHNIVQQKISRDNIYQYLICFDKLYSKFTDAEKKEFMNSFVESVEIYDKEQPDGRFLKRIKLRFPVFFDGKEIEEISWDNETTVEPIEVVEKYCDTYIGEDSHFPIVRLKPQGSIKRCPLLKDNKCTVHESKPTVCATFPIGRMIALDGNSKVDLSNPWNYNKIQYIYSPPGCGDDSVTHTVREWFASFGIDIEDEFYIKWNMVLGKCCRILKKAEKNFELPKTMEFLWDGIFAGLYCLYDTDKDFMPQFESNFNRINKIMDMIDAQYEDEKPKTEYHKKVKKKKRKKQKNKNHIRRK